MRTYLPQIAEVTVLMSPAVVSTSITALRKETAVVHEARELGLRLPGGWNIVARCGHRFVGTLAGVTGQDQRPCDPCRNSSKGGRLQIVMLGADRATLQREVQVLISKKAMQYEKTNPTPSCRGGLGPVLDRVHVDPGSMF